METHDSSRELLVSLPAELGEMFRPYAGRIVRAIIHEIQRAVPDYSRPLHGKFGKTIVDAAENVVLKFFDGLGTRSAPSDVVELFRARGRVDFASGRNLDGLQAAIRTGGRAAWREIGALSRQKNLSHEHISVLAEAILAHVDELSAAAVEGFREAENEAPERHDLRRRQLVGLLLADGAAPAGSVEDLAAAIGWTIPERVSVIALERLGAAADLPVGLLEDQVLIDLDREQPCMLTAAPEEHLAALEENWQGWRCAVAPPVALADAPAALRTARRTLDAFAESPTEGPVWCTDQLSTLWLLTEESLAAEVGRKALRPLEELNDKQRERLSDTLLAMLESRGGAPEIARRLDIHPQTVRARLHQLEEIFGDSLRDPDERFDMQLALRAQRLLATDVTAVAHPLPHTPAD